MIELLDYFKYVSIKIYFLFHIIIRNKIDKVLQNTNAHNVQYFNKMINFDIL